MEKRCQFVLLMSFKFELFICFFAVNRVETRTCLKNSFKPSPVYKQQIRPKVLSILRYYIPSIGNEKFILDYQ